MSFTFGFYNALNHDRRYNAIEMSRIFDGLLTDGVYPTVGHKMMVRASSTDNSVIVGSGRAWFNHSWNYNDADMPLTGPASHILYPRWDAVVLDINSSIEYRTNSIIWVTGTAASSPVKPTMVHTETHNQYPLAYIYRPANDNTIPANRITNSIGTVECPYAAGLLVDRKNIAQLENNDHATKAYAAGEYFIWYDQLYKVTVPISQGAPIIAYPTTGFNVKSTTVTNELYEKLVFDITPTSGSGHAVTSDGIYKALGNNKIIQPTTTVNQNDPANGKAVITSKGLYAALGNRISIETAAPASGGTKLMTNGQVYTALGNRTSIQTSAPVENDTKLITNGQIYTALGNRSKMFKFQEVVHEIFNGEVGANSVVTTTQEFLGLRYVAVWFCGWYYDSSNLDATYVKQVLAEVHNPNTRYGTICAVANNSGSTINVRVVGKFIEVVEQ